jgi:hypothetical protein
MISKLCCLALLPFVLAKGPSQSNTTLTRACHLPGHTTYDFCNTSLSINARVANLISLLKPEEKAPLLTARESPLGAIPRLGLPEYDWGTNCIHGAQSRCGSKCPTSFPNPNAQGAAWNRSLWRDMAQVTGVELRALWLADLGENHVDNLPHLGLDCWSPNININRDPVRSFSFLSREFSVHFSEASSPTFKSDGVEIWKRLAKILT